MRRLVAGLLLATWLAPLVLADQKDPRLEPLFARLKAAPDETAAGLVAGEIWRIWAETADPQNSALYARGAAAMEASDTRTALAAFDLLIEREPGFAEAWNKRATVRFMVGDDAGSMTDIARTLALEPRHFGALSGLALIHVRLGEPEKALEIYRRTLAIHPFLLGARVNIPALRDQIKGDPT